MNYILRKASSADAGEIEELFVEMLRTVCPGNTPEGYEAGYLDKFFSAGEDWICVAEYENTVIGFLSIEVHRPGNYIYLDDLSVTAEHRNKGVGTQLIFAAEKYARELGVDRILFHVEKANKDAYRLYTRLGFSPETEEGSRIRMKKTVQ